MPGRPAAPLLRRAVSSLALAVAFSCGDDDAKAPPEPPGAPSIVITELRPRGNDRVEVRPRSEREGDGPIAGPDPVVIGCDRRLGVTVALENWPLRAPGACRSNQCGSVRVQVEAPPGGRRVERDAATATVLLDLEPLDDVLDGPVRVHAELRRSDGSVPVDGAGAPLADEIQVSFARSRCGTGGEAGAGGEGGAGGGT